ncbi:P-loop containing nucleoside triphosphate hydrolase protein [Auriculariales sp. MPI-PUGE-AT-0066]|nr:P-loop containing nucleoside triphosphate hydrolase protein [Auriculariales sp. MPI-PUGE-AT-0066]
MDSAVRDLVQSLKDSLHSQRSASNHNLASTENKQSRERLLIGISGFPASGKSTLARVVAQQVNRDLGGDVAVVVGLDGWHFSRAHLDTMPDPALAHARRGAHWTFDGESYASFAQTLLDGTKSTFAPSFDHALKDPVADDVEVKSSHEIVIIEGLYVFLDIAPWRTAGELLHERWFIDVEEIEARNRLARRHVKSGICPDEASGLARADQNDLPNGRFVRENMLIPTRTIVSVADNQWSV